MSERRPWSRTWTASEIVCWTGWVASIVASGVTHDILWLSVATAFQVIRLAVVLMVINARRTR